MPSKREARRIRAKDKTTENRAEKRKRGDEKPSGEKTDSPSDKKVDGKPKERTPGKRQRADARKEKEDKILALANKIVEKRKQGDEQPSEKKTNGPATTKKVEKKPEVDGKSKEKTSGERQVEKADKKGAKKTVEKQKQGDEKQSEEKADGPAEKNVEKRPKANENPNDQALGNSDTKGEKEDKTKAKQGAKRQKDGSTSHKKDTSAAPSPASKYTDDDREVLVRIVKEAVNTWGTSHGTFVEFVRKTQPADYKYRTRSDPNLHTLQVLESFVDGLQDGDQKKMIKRHWEYEKFARRVKAGEVKLDPLRHKLQVEKEVPGVWELVYLTQKNSDYNKFYSFPSHAKHWRRTDWVAPRTFTAAAKETNRPRLLAIDCEMCTTTKGPKELLGVSVVDEDGEVLLDTLVQPRGTVIDLKTNITGVTMADLEKVTTTCHEVQLKVEALCAADKGAVLIGHSLNHDMMALRLDHRLVIDTAFLFRYQGLASCTPSLADLADRLLKCPIRTEAAIHSSREDAVAAMQLVKYALQYGLAPVPAPSIKVAAEQLQQLFMHRLPSSVSADTIKAVFQGTDNSPVPIKVQISQVDANKKFTSATIEFENVDKANTAFKKLLCHTRTSKDARGRPQKEVALPKSPQTPTAASEENPSTKKKPDNKHDKQYLDKDGNVLVLVRKNACHGGLMFHVPDATAKASEPNGTSDQSKKSNKKRRKLM
eukprot:CAMPEP_0198211550 /NCGR_PEP_ID=MMETSP1445-20131203/24446_1 /TAXON_ID=36898 /ORGANISM="Pyramimonas sp., Strain CCMP2087" /LENGTH=709 /DNA_ID=CAMNT_0043885825 /DNA_START=87 /DNA_END=2216 /DNA_ORIENTATION=+